MQSFFDSHYPLTSGRGSLAPAFNDKIDPVVLSANTLYRHPIPTGGVFVLISFTDHVWARAGDSDDVIAVPSATATDGLAGELNPSARRIPTGATHILLIGPNACKGTLSFYG